MKHWKYVSLAVCVALAIIGLGLVGCEDVSTSGQAITVTVRYNYRLSMPFIGSILGSTTIPITASVTDTILNPKCP